MYRKFFTASAALLTAAALGACGSPEDTLKPDSAPPADVIETADEIPSSSVKELESSAAVKPTTEDKISDTEQTDSDEENSDTEDSEESGSDEEKILPTSIDVGGLTLSAAEIPFESTVKLSDEKTSDAAISGDTLYVLDGKKLRQFTLGDELKENESTTLTGAYTRIDIDAYGRVYLSRDKFDCAMLDEFGQLRPLDAAGKLSMSKVMEYGLCTSGGEITRYADAESGVWSSVKESDTQYPENVSAVEFSGNHVLIAHTDNGESCVTVCGYDGDTLATTSGGSIGEDITAVTESSGVIAASSCGDLCLWNEEGELIGRLTGDDAAALFGVQSPVEIKRLFPDESGSMLAFCTDSADKAQARVFRISGF